MDIRSSISYRRFLNDYYREFRIRHFNDIIDFLEKDEDHTFDQYLNEAETSLEISTKFSYVVTSITNELGFNYFDLDVTDGEKDSSKEDKMYDDAVKMIKVKLKDDICDSSAYFHLAEM